MARITVEDCLKHVDNRFDLVLKAAKRARQLVRTPVEPYVSWSNDKSTVVALREIAAGHTEFEEFKEEKSEKIPFFRDTDLNDAKDFRHFGEETEGTKESGVKKSHESDDSNDHDLM